VTDFLDRLIARSVERPPGDLPIARAVVPSPFSPPAAGGGLVDRPPTEWAADASFPVAAPPEHAATRERIPPRDGALVVSARERSTRAGHERAQTALGAADPADDAMLPELARPAPDPTVAAVPRVHVTPESEIRDPRRDDTRARTAAPHAGDAVPAAQNVAAPVERRATAGDQAPRLAEPPSVRAANPSSAPPSRADVAIPRPLEPPVSVRSRVHPAGRAPDAPPRDDASNGDAPSRSPPPERDPYAGSEPARAEPPIVVTIGRVEVRAVSAAAPAPPPPSSVPRMSLDEYLRTRGEAAR
jgi:hypothetical protein